MRKNDNIRPTGIKGNEKIDRMKSLMGITPIHENIKRSVIELTKLGPDGKVYGIVRENHNYFIKVSDKTSNLIAEDFKYIGGLMNKTEEIYESYAKATKHLNLKFISLNESLNGHDVFNTLKNDNLTESFVSYNEDPKPSQPDELLGTESDFGKYDGFGDGFESGIDTDGKSNADNDDDDDDDDDDKLTETEKAIDDIIRELTGESLKENVNNNKLKIGKAISNISKGEKSSKKKA